MNKPNDEKTFRDAEPYHGDEILDADGREIADHSEDTPAKPKKKKRPIRKLLMFGLPLVLALGGAYFWVTGGRYIETEDAYVQQDRVTVMPQVSGQIASVAVDENQFVQKGALLFTIDDSVYSNAVESDKAKLEAARLDVMRLKAAYQQAVAERQSASDAANLAQTTFDRQNALVKKGVISNASLDDARLKLQQANQALSSADQQVISAKAALGGNPDIDPDQHPEVLEALAALHSAELDLKHTKVYAPEAGIVSQTAQLQNGQYVTPQTSVMSLVETETSWIQANYKETELTDMQVGQPAEISFDTYPDQEFKGHVGSIGAGTGSEFALLPAQNATGNWVKVVQRVPVRIALDNGQDLPILRAGMSTTVTVDTGHSRGVPDFAKPVVSALDLAPYLEDQPSHAAPSAQPDTPRQKGESAADAAASGGQ
ncbi:HlyD family secretion protein [Fulvimarina sp. MAC3]|uniref:HlyD family secretion protein n=1 Tax=Fulvimarina sp. MAC3 TaxID=3148887 RepID=UPI0031FC5298